MNKKFFTLFFFLGIFCVPGLSFAFEEIRYEISAVFSPKEKSIEARETLTFKNNSGRELKEILLRVYPHHHYSAREKKRLYEYASYFKTDPYPDGFDPGSFALKNIKEANKGVLPYAWAGDDETVLKVGLPQPLKNGDELCLQMEFSLKVPHRIGRYGWHENTFALNRWYPILSVLDEKGWREDPDYLLHMPYMSEAAYYRLMLDVPEEYVVVSGCDETKEIRGSLDRKIVSLSSALPLRELTLALSKDYSVTKLEEGGVTILSYFFKKDEAYGRFAAECAAGLMKYYAKQFGPYPYKQFSIAPVYLGYGGSQNAGIIFLDARDYAMPPFSKRHFDFLVSHETGHQWWYNIVGNDEYRELWLDEGINSYWTLRYCNEKYGCDAGILQMPRWCEFFVPNPTFETTRTYRWRYFVQRGLDWPVMSDLESFYEPSLIFSVAYGKGSSIVGMLASIVGEKEFTEIMRRYFDRYKFKNAGAQDFIKIASEVSGRDLKGFFNEWLRTTAICDYRLRREKDDLVLEKRGQIAMPVEAELLFSDGVKKRFVSDGTHESEIIVRSEGKNLKSAVIDPACNILDIDRLNNRWPRRVDIKVVPLYHSLYDIPIFLSADAYSWITGPSFSKYGVGIRSSFQRPGESILYAATHYDANSQSLTSSAGFEKNNLGRKLLSWGFEFINKNPCGSEDPERLNSYKLYLRQELGLGASFFDLSNHATLYLLHNQAMGKAGFIGSREDTRNTQYRKNKETICGASYYLASAGPFPDPSLGFKLSATEEIGGHMLGGSDAFIRTALEFDRYLEIKKGHKIALRFKAGGGHPKDKYLFYLGSDTELRGYAYKEIKGSSVLLASAEYRCPLLRDIDGRFFWNTFSFDQLQGVLFFDTGSAWFNKFNEPGFKKDVGLGLRFYFNVAGSAERFALRIDFARPLSGEDKDNHIWVGVNHAF